MDIDKRELTDLEQIGKGMEGNIYSCHLDGKLKVYKELNNMTKNKIEKIRFIAQMANPDLDKRVTLPEDLVLVNGVYTGYLMKYNIGFEDIGRCSYYRRNILINALNYAKQSLQILHNDYKIIHGDIHPGNLSCSDILETSKFIDMDNCITNKFPIDYSSLNYKTYAIKFGINKELDIYLFNLLTYFILYYVPWKLVYDSIRDRKFDEKLEVKDKEEKKLIKSLDILHNDTKPDNNFLIDLIKE